VDKDAEVNYGPAAIPSAWQHWQAPRTVPPLPKEPMQHLPPLKLGNALDMPLVGAHDKCITASAPGRSLHHAVGARLRATEGSVGLGEGRLVSMAPGGACALTMPYERLTVVGAAVRRVSEAPENRCQRARRTAARISSGEMLSPAFFAN
jgi:hypothetical protein